ncbi:MAG: response regulator transcription factor [Oscillospiraceae bacterium]|nr:response regulator transcription factor [Oscillospiraceae bacterium]
MTKILLAEDDESLGFGLKYSLEKEGFSVILADSKKSAELLFDDSIDLLLLDIMLPDGSGYDICKNVRKMRDVPVIFLTACDSEVNVITGLDMGADDYICKPFRLGELLSRINAVLRRYRKSENNDAEFSESFAEDAEGLTAIESRLLRFLRANKGQTLTRLQILNKLWDNKGEFVDDNTLSVHISRLREKVGAEKIVTVRGVGYRWEE